MTTVTRAIRWISENDEPTETLLDPIMNQLTVCLAAHLFNATREDIAKAVIRERQIRSRMIAAMEGKD